MTGNALDATPGVREVLGQAAAAALYCGAEGQINLHKLFEAALYAATRQAGYARYRAVTPAALADAVDGLRRQQLTPALVDALAAGVATAWDGGVPLYDLTPDVYVCRVCGYAALDAAPPQCPRCDALSATFRHFAGIFNVDNPDPLASLALLRSGPATVAAMIDDLPEELLVRAPAAGEWSLQRTLQHLLDAQNLFARRLTRMLAEENPSLAVEFVWTMAGEARTTQEMLDEFGASRAATVAQLEGLPLRDWGRTGRHEEFGTVTVLHQAGYFAYHEAFHSADFAVKRRQLGVEAA